jgi:hypothetical protein
MAVFNRNFPMNNPTGGDWGPSSSHAERSFRDVVAVRLDNVKAELANLRTFSFQTLIYYFSQSQQYLFNVSQRFILQKKPAVVVRRR